VAAPLLNTYPREKFGTLGLGNLKAINLSCSLVFQLSGYPQIWKAKEGQEKNKKGKKKGKSQSTSCNRIQTGLSTTKLHTGIFNNKLFFSFI
jgi:hypothetical protein